MDGGFEYLIQKGHHNKKIEELQKENERLKLKMYDELRKLAEERIRQGKDLGILGKGGEGTIKTSYKIPFEGSKIQIYKDKTM